MSLSYIDHQRTRFWRTHEEIFDFRKNRDNNWVELHSAQEQRGEERRGVRESRRVKWETERKEREKADHEYRSKREDERLDRGLTRKATEDTERLSVNDSRRQRQWNTHTTARAKMRERQAERLEDQKKFADHELEELRRRRDDLSARQLIRQDKLLKQESKRSEEVSRKKTLGEKHERNRLLSDDQD